MLLPFLVMKFRPSPELLPRGERSVGQGEEVKEKTRKIVCAFSLFSCEKSNDLCR